MVELEDPIEKLPWIERPFELLDLNDGETLSFDVLEWGLYKAKIQPRFQGFPKLIRVLRVKVSDKYKETPPPYYDLSSQTLIYQLLSYLETADLKGKVFTITKHGYQPKARFTLEVGPEALGG